MVSNNSIKLSLPLNAAYVSTIRQTSSSICERMNFSTSDVEDIRTAVSETATFLINTCSSNICTTFDVNFQMENEKLFVNISIPTSNIDFSKHTDNMALMLAKGCMDEFNVNIDKNSNNTFINLVKEKLK